MTTNLKSENKATAAAAAQGPTATRRDVYLRDGVVLLVLSLITVGLFLITLLLFKSFEAHRADLGLRWSGRGRLALAQGHPDQAASALRTALSYTPDDYDDQLLLAQALAGAGHREAADSYFLSLWAVHPGDGFLNLQLARLARQRGDAQAAVNYYRASIFGNWEQSGVERRREVRLELADYLVERGQAPAARAELLIAAGNAPEKDTALQLQIADHLRGVGDTVDALHLYRLVTTRDPHNLQALANEGRAEFALEQYPAAARSLSEATELARHEHQQDAEELGRLAGEARRLPELSLSRDLLAQQRGDHLLLDASIAQQRLKTCTVALLPQVRPGGTKNASLALLAPPPAPATAVTLADLKSRWSAQGHPLKKHSLEQNAELEDTVTQLIEDTELALAPICGAPTGDDALLLGIARKAQAADPGVTP